MRTGVIVRSRQPKKSAKLARGQDVLKQIRKGVYGAEGYPLHSPLLKEEFQKMRRETADDAKRAEKVFSRA